MDFLFENTWLIFIVIAIFTSLLNKAKGNQGKQNSRQRQPIQPRNVANQQKSGPIQEARNHDVTPVIPKRNIEKEYADRKKQAEEQMQVLKDKQKVLEKSAQSLQAASAMRSKRVDSSPKKEGKPAISIEKQKLVDGVVWAEILGPPRALSPHKSIRQQR